MICKCKKRKIAHRIADYSNSLLQALADMNKEAVADPLNAKEIIQRDRDIPSIPLTSIEEILDGKCDCMGEVSNPPYDFTEPARVS